MSLITYRYNVTCTCIYKKSSINPTCFYGGDIDIEHSFSLKNGYFTLHIKVHSDFTLQVLSFFFGVDSVGSSSSSLSLSLPSSSTTSSFSSPEL